MGGRWRRKTEGEKEEGSRKGKEKAERVKRKQREER